MDTIWLEDFVALARHLNFTRAALSRNVTQSAFSRRIRALEHWLGTELVERAALPLRLTQNGLDFLPVATETLERLTAARSRFHQQAPSPPVTITLSLAHSASVSLFPRVKQHLRRMAGNFYVHMRVANQDAAIEDLETGASDFALAYRHADVPRAAAFNALDQIEVADDALIVVGRPGDWETHARIPLIAFNESIYLGRVCTRIAPDARFEIVDAVGLPADARARALDGEAAGLALRSMVEADLASGTLVELQPKPLAMIAVDLVLAPKPSPAASLLWRRFRTGDSAGRHSRSDWRQTVPALASRAGMA